MRQTICSVFWAAALTATLFSGPAQAVLLGSGSNGNTTALSLQTAGGPLVTQAGFNNIGRSGTGNASVTYLSNGWGITAGHVTMDATFNTVNLGGTPYTVDLNSITYLTNPDNSLADLKLFRLTTTPALPSITSSLISSVTPNSPVVMVGNGQSISGSQLYWQVDKTNNNNWQWQSQGSQPALPGPDDYSGHVIDLNHSIRWGDNLVIASNILVHTADLQNIPLYVKGYVTQLDNLAYTGSSPLTDEAQASNGDSGGGVFVFDGGQWKLSGIMIAINDTYNNQPANTVLFGDQTLIADLSIYRSQIVAIVPEPGSAALALVAAVMLSACWWRRRR